MVLLAVISRKHPWKPWPIVRNVINVIAGIVMAALAGIAYSENFGPKYVQNGWAVPTMTIIWFFILVLTHVGSSAPVVVEAIRKKSISPLREGAKRQPSDQRTLSWHGGGGISPGQMTQSNSSDRVPVGRQDTFYGQIGEDGTAYGQAYRYSHEQDSGNAVPAYGSSTSYGTDQPIRRPVQVSPVSSGVSPGYATQSTAYDH